MTGTCLPGGVCAVILAGGSSRRMGRNKAFLEYEGEVLIERLIRYASCITDQVVISANESELFGAFPIPVIPDRIRGSGPLAGIHAAMSATSARLLLALACDMPRLSLPTLQLIVSAHKPPSAITVPRTGDGRPHPLCAVYDRSLLPEIERRLLLGRNRLLDLLAASPTQWLETGFDDLDFANWNSPEDLRS